jgi:outer membrane protein
MRSHRVCALSRGSTFVQAAIVATVDRNQSMWRTAVQTSRHVFVRPGAMNMNNKKLVLACAAVLAMAAVGPASAAGAGSWVFKVGVHNVNPKSDNGSLADGALDVEIGGNTRPTIGLGYWLTDNLQLDVLGAIPFQHDLKLNGADAGDFKHLPPTVTLQYHFNPAGDINPFVGVGLNYTLVYDESPAGPIAGTDLAIDNSFGVALQGGIEFKLNDQWSIAGDVRWMDIDSKVKVDGADVGTVHVDPICVGIFAVYNF